MPLETDGKMRDLRTAANELLGKVDRNEPLTEGEALFVRGVVEEFVKTTGMVQWVSQSLQVDLGISFWNKR